MATVARRGRPATRLTPALVTPVLAGIADGRVSADRLGVTYGLVLKLVDYAPGGRGYVTKVADPNAVKPVRGPTAKVLGLTPKGRDYLRKNRKVLADGASAN